MQMRDKVDGRVVVVKEVPYKNISEVRTIGNEARLLRKLDHPNVVSYLNIFTHTYEDPTVSTRLHNNMCLVMEYADMGDLNAWLKARHDGLLMKKRLATSTTAEASIGGDDDDDGDGDDGAGEVAAVEFTWRVSERTLWKLAASMCFALEYVHSLNIIHRDLKPDNVFLCSRAWHELQQLQQYQQERRTSEPDDAPMDRDRDGALVGERVGDERDPAGPARGEEGDWVVKLGDFGLGYFLESKQKASTQAGTLVYWSPSQMAGAKPGKADDVYAAGCVLFETCLGPGYPATSLLLDDKRRENLRLVEKLAGKRFAQLVSSMVAAEEAERPSFAELVQEFADVFAPHKVPHATPHSPRRNDDHAGTDHDDLNSEDDESDGDHSNHSGQTNDHADDDNADAVN